MTHEESGDKHLVNWKRFVEADTEDSHQCLEFCQYDSRLEADEAVQWVKLCIALVRAAERKMVQTKEGMPIKPSPSMLADPLWELSGMRSNVAAINISKYRFGAQREVAGFRELFDLLQPEIGVEEETYWMNRLDSYNAERFIQEEESWKGLLMNEQRVTTRNAYLERIAQVWGIELQQEGLRCSANAEDDQSIERHRRMQPFPEHVHNPFSMLKREDAYYPSTGEPSPFWQSAMHQRLQQIEDVIDWGIEDDEPEIVWRIGASGN
ncbi:MAG: hypothetical protein Q9160_003760 [Pyrenula sp. 1 TL-2023]